MIIKYRRCIHCNDVYLTNSYEEHNDRYCPSCYDVIVTALKDVKPKFEKKVISVQELSKIKGLEKFSKINKDLLDQWEAQNAIDNEDLIIKGNIIGKRLGFPLFDISNPKNKNISIYVNGRDEFKGIQFWLSYWTLTDEVSISVEAEYDVEKSEIIGLWRFFEKTFTVQLKGSTQNTEGDK